MLSAPFLDSSFKDQSIFEERGFPPFQTGPNFCMKVVNYTSYFIQKMKLNTKKQAEWVRRIVSCRQSWSTHTTPQNLVLAPLLLSSYEHGVTSIVIRLPTLELIFSSHVSFERHL
ncbi:hypothetical protein TWF679_002832 [Orbilia oligospora]|uniref:Uncharacterized protein n=2 Tax=Orbilia oligospora TaxID=2813651 RepID=A0A8H8USP1_ORBOL|nr:hypothetical protein TWF679_002832 [Orbilia oligospora]